MKKAVIFDLDGTLTDTIASIKYCGDRALAPFGYGPFPESDYKYFVGDGAANLVKRALAASGDRELSHFEEAFALYKKYFAADCMYQVKPYEGIPELLKELKGRGVRIAVFSNKPHAQTIDVVETVFGKGYFDILQGQTEGVPIKPDPAGVFGILQQLGLETSDILYLGDTATDMKTGKGAGAFTVGALWGFRDRAELEEAQADAIIAHPTELLSYL
jgi:phosphoglycolate phosphatase